jgi:hypothetical protein
MFEESLSGRRGHCEHRLWRPWSSTPADRGCRLQRCAGHGTATHRGCTRPRSRAVGNQFGVARRSRQRRNRRGPISPPLIDVAARCRACSMCVSGVVANDPQPGTCCSGPHPPVEQLVPLSSAVTTARKIDAHDDFNARVGRILTLSVLRTESVRRSYLVSYCGRPAKASVVVVNPGSPLVCGGDLL